MKVVSMQLQGSGRGVGTARSVEHFSHTLGVDFEKRMLIPGCENVGLGDDAFASSPSVGGSLEENVRDLNGREMSSVFALVGQFMNGA